MGSNVGEEFVAATMCRLPPAKVHDAHQRLGQLLAEALGPKHPALDDWATLGFALKQQVAVPPPGFKFVQVQEDTRVVWTDRQLRLLLDTPTGYATLRNSLNLPQSPPIDMVLHCPACHVQHIDAPDIQQAKHGEYGWEPWNNPPHRSHLCHYCGHVWRPADVPTNGVAATKTKGKRDCPVTATDSALPPPWDCGQCNTPWACGHEGQCTFPNRIKQGT